jgi:predicted dehydrogenase
MSSWGRISKHTLRSSNKPAQHHHENPSILSQKLLSGTGGHRVSSRCPECFPNSNLQVACVGFAGMGHADLSNFGSHKAVKFAGFCDVDSTQFAKADAAFPNVPHFADYRQMLADLGDKVDAVSVSIPDHMHASVSMEAMKHGKHVFCQKPLAHTVWEARQMRLLAEKTGVITHMGNQKHSEIEYRLATRLIHEGAIGKVKEVFSWIDVTGNERNKLLAPPATGVPVPAHLNWDLWLGCAPERDYASVYHPFVWRDWQDFGGGALGDFGCHILDPVFTSLGLNAPVSISAKNTGVNQHIWPTRQIIEYLFPGNDRTTGPTLKVTWSDGGLKPDRGLAQLPDDLNLPPNGSLFLGEKGNMVLAHVAAPRMYPLETFKGFKYPQEQGFNHWHVWIDACLSGQKTSAGFHYSGPLAETVQLGNVATRLANGPFDEGSKTLGEAVTLEWDAAAFKITNRPEANELLTKPYRKGWELPTV